MNNSHKIGYVVTTIQHPTEPLLTLAKKSHDSGSKFYIIGDKKSPLDFFCPNSKYFSVNDQISMEFCLGDELPFNSYSRKMLGYLAAIRDNCYWIRETDDDNYPLESFFAPPNSSINVREILTSVDGWINPYQYFTKIEIWPRGFPINLVLRNRNEFIASENHTLISSKVVISQGLANGEPDVDAIYRLVVNDNINIKFLDSEPIKISKSFYAPFNSQATTWEKSVFPLMYLPVTCSFRMTDIWRSFVAQRILRENSGDIIFTAPTVYQERNPHDFLKDFKDEVSGYLLNQNLIDVLNQTQILGGISNMHRDLKECYKSLIAANFLDLQEEIFLDCWLRDLTRIDSFN